MPLEANAGQMEEVSMHRLIRPVFVSLLALSMSGCVSSKPIRYYTIEFPAAPTITSGAHTESLLVAPVTGPEIFRDTPIAYRIGSNEIGTYQYSQWAQPPVEILQGNLIRVLRATGNYQSVSSLGSTSNGQYVVRGRLYDFEEVDGASISALVSMEFELYERKSGKVVWSHYYSQSEPVQGKEMSAIVSALDTNLDRGLKEVAAGLNQYFLSNPAKAVASR
jgi:ABC-type uncharacterized transport system auxiliary subunit